MLDQTLPPDVFEAAYRRRLTPKQSEILNFVTSWLEVHGYAPSLAEIGKRFQLTSLSTVHKHLENLQEKGYVRRRFNQSRSLEVCALERCPTCGQLTLRQKGAN